MSLKHQEGCNGPDCSLLSGGPLDESLLHNYILNVPYNPLDDEWELYLPLPLDRGLRLYDDGFWICHDTTNTFIDRRSAGVKSRHHAMSVEFKRDRQERRRKRINGSLVRRALTYVWDRLFGH